MIVTQIPEIEKIIQFLALCSLMLVTGVFWGLYFSLSRSYHLLDVAELANIGTIIINNLAKPMRVISTLCIGLTWASLFFYPEKSSFDFYLMLASVILIATSLVITVAIEIPINNQVITWTPANAPSNRHEILKRWQLFNMIRTCTALASFACFAAVVGHLV